MKEKEKRTSLGVIKSILSDEKFQSDMKTRILSILIVVAIISFLVILGYSFVSGGIATKITVAVIFLIAGTVLFAKVGGGNEAP